MAELAFDVNCPHCKRSLMDPYRTVNNKPSIRAFIEVEGQKGMIRMSSIYGSYDYYTELKIKKNDIVTFKCPHCEQELSSKDECTECNAPMVNFKLSIGGMVCVCSRNGCKNHSVGFVDLTSALNTFYHKYKYGE